MSHTPGPWKVTVSDLPPGFDAIYRCTKHPDRDAVPPIACRRCQECHDDAIRNYAPAMVKRDQAQRHIGRPEHDTTTWGEPIDERNVRKRREGIL